MTSIDPKLVQALSEQLAQRRALLARGARHVGWKLGMGDRESIGGSIAVGHLTSATVFANGARCDIAGAGALHADAEIAVQLASGVDPSAGADAVHSAIAGYGLALELVDLGPLPGEPETAVATNVFHRAVAFGELQTTPRDGLVSLSVAGELRAFAPPDDVAERILAAARVLDAVGERLQARDRIITGSVVQLAVEASGEVTAAVTGDAPVRLHVVC
jgi:2-keto-4-pentenoate hydratase